MDSFRVLYNFVVSLFSKRHKYFLLQFRWSECDQGTLGHHTDGPRLGTDAGHLALLTYRRLADVPVLAGKKNHKSSALLPSPFP